jgi:hypothetical protein
MPHPWGRAPARYARSVTGGSWARSTLVACLAAATVTCSRPAADGVTDLDGQPIDPLSSDAPVTVLLFVATDCPISNRYVPELGRLRARFEPRGVSFWLVYPTAEESPANIASHLHEFGLTFPAVRDPRHSLVRRSQVTVTPESAVFLRGGTLAYHGRIDDLIVDFGESRPEPTRHELADALDAVLAGRPAAAAAGHAVGCAITGTN